MRGEVKALRKSSGRDGTGRLAGESGVLGATGCSFGRRLENGKGTDETLARRAEGVCPVAKIVDAEVGLERTPA